MKKLLERLLSLSLLLALGAPIFIGAMEMDVPYAPTEIADEQFNIYKIGHKEGDTRIPAASYTELGYKNPDKDIHFEFWYKGDPQNFPLYVQVGSTDKLSDTWIKLNVGDRLFSTRQITQLCYSFSDDHSDAQCFELKKSYKVFVRVNEKKLARQTGALFVGDQRVPGGGVLSGMSKTTGLFRGGILKTESGLSMRNNIENKDIAILQSPNSDQQTYPVFDNPKIEAWINLLLEQKLDYLGDSIKNFEYSPDGRYLLISRPTKDKGILTYSVYDTHTQEELIHIQSLYKDRNLQGLITYSDLDGDFEIEGQSRLIFSPQGKYLCTISKDSSGFFVSKLINTINFYNLKDRKYIKLAVSKDASNNISLLFSPDERYFALHDISNEVVDIYDLAKEKKIKLDLGKGIKQFVFQPNKENIFVLYNNNKAALFNLITGKQTIVPTQGTFLTILPLPAIYPEHPYLIGRDSNNMLHVKNLTTLTDTFAEKVIPPQFILPKYSDKIIIFKNEQKTKAWAYSIFDENTNQKPHIIDLSNTKYGTIENIISSPDGRYLSIRTSENIPVLFNLETQEIQKLTDDVNALEFSKDGKYLILTRTNNSFLYNLSTQTSMYEDDLDFAQKIKISPDGKYITYLGNNRNIYSLPLGKASLNKFTQAQLNLISYIYDNKNHKALLDDEQYTQFKSLPIVLQKNLKPFIEYSLKTGYMEQLPEFMLKQIRKTKKSIHPVTEEIQTWLRKQLKLPLISKLLPKLSIDKLKLVAHIYENRDDQAPLYEEQQVLFLSLPQALQDALHPFIDFQYQLNQEQADLIKEIGDMRQTGQEIVELTEEQRDIFETLPEGIQDTMSEMVK